MSCHVVITQEKAQEKTQEKNPEKNTVSEAVESNTLRIIAILVIYILVI